MICRNCGKEINNDSIFCEYCGAKPVMKFYNPNNEIFATTVAEVKKQKVKRVITIVISVIFTYSAIFGALYGAYSYYKSHHSNSDSPVSSITDEVTDSENNNKPSKQNHDKDKTEKKQSVEKTTSKFESVNKHSFGNFEETNRGSVAYEYKGYVYFLEDDHDIEDFGTLTILKMKKNDFENYYDPYSGGTIHKTYLCNVKDAYQLIVYDHYIYYIANTDNEGKLIHEIDLNTNKETGIINKDNPLVNKEGRPANGAAALDDSFNIYIRSGKILFVSMNKEDTHSQCISYNPKTKEQKVIYTSKIYAGLYLNKDGLVVDTDNDGSLVLLDETGKTIDKKYKDDNVETLSENSNYIVTIDRNNDRNKNNKITVIDKKSGKEYPGDYIYNAYNKEDMLLSATTYDGVDFTFSYEGFGSDGGAYYGVYTTGGMD